MAFWEKQFVHLLFPFRIITAFNYLITYQLPSTLLQICVQFHHDLALCSASTVLPLHFLFIYSFIIILIIIILFFFFEILLLPFLLRIFVYRFKFYINISTSK